MRKLLEMKERIKPEHKDVYLSTLHIIKAIDDLEQNHRELMGSYAIAGYKIIGSEEELYRQTLQSVREIITNNFIKTIEDIEHKYVKGYTKNFPDGVE